MLQGKLFMVQLACAGGSGALAKTAVAPLERIKVRLSQEWCALCCICPMRCAKVFVCAYMCVTQKAVSSSVCTQLSLLSAL